MCQFAKDDIKVVTEFPCLLGHPVFRLQKLIIILLLDNVYTEI